MDYLKEYKKWCESDEFDEATKEELLDMIRKNGEDEKIKTIVDEYIDYLSIGVSNLINIFEPEAVGIGGSFCVWQ